MSSSGVIILLLAGLGLVVFFLLTILNRLTDLNKELRQLRQELMKLSASNTKSHAETISPTTLTSPEIRDQLENSESASVHPEIQRSAKPVQLLTTPTNVRKSFFKQTDWEKFIGENLINKIGIAILVLGIGFFVRYAIEQNWIKETGRVLIGLLSGIVLLGIAHRLRLTYKAFSSVLVGGGLAVLYFTIALAFHQYQLLSQVVAFLCMVIITGLSIFLALWYDRKELAVLALLGGFASPFMTTAGGSNYLILFGYVLILDVGMLILAYFKRWPIINIISYLATVALFAGWLFSGIAWVKDAPYLGSWVFAVLFYLVFVGMDIIYNLRRDRKFTLSEISLLLSNTGFFYLVALYLLSHIQGGTYQGLYTSALAFLNGGLAWYLHTRTRSDKQINFLLAGIAVLFLYLALLLELLYQLQASTLVYETRVLLTAIYNYLVISLLLVFSARYLAIRHIRRLVWLGLAAAVSYILLALSIITDIRDAYVQTAKNAGLYYLHYGALLLVLFILFRCYLLMNRVFTTSPRWQQVATWFACALLVFISSTELDNLVVLSTYVPGASIPGILNQNHKIGFAILWGLSSFGFMLVGMKQKVKSLRIISLTLFTITLLKLFLFDIKDISAGGRIAAFILLGVLLLVVSFLYQKLKILILNDDQEEV